MEFISPGKFDSQFIIQEHENRSFSLLIICTIVNTSYCSKVQTMGTTCQLDQIICPFIFLRERTEKSLNTNTSLQLQHNCKSVLQDSLA